MSWAFVRNIETPANWEFSCQLFNGKNVNTPIMSIYIPFVGGAYKEIVHDETIKSIHSVVGDSTMKIGLDENGSNVIEYRGCACENQPGTAFVYSIFELPDISMRQLIEYFGKLSLDGIQENSLKPGYFNYHDFITERYAIAQIGHERRIPNNVAKHIIKTFFGKPNYGGSRTKTKKNKRQKIKGKNLT
jgi:hypothetical protein